MLLDKILDYQKIDREFYLLENEYRNSQEVKVLGLLHMSFYESTDNYEKLMKETEDLFKSFEKGVARLNEIDKLESEIGIDMKTIVDQTGLDMFDKSLSKYEEYLSSTEREINKITKRLSEIKFEAQKLQERIAETKKRYLAQKKARDKKKEDIQRQASPIVMKLREMKGDIDEVLLHKYMDRRKDNLIPAFVEYVDGNCTGCGMDISIEMNTKILKSGDYAECPECRRIVYKA